MTMGQVIIIVLALALASCGGRHDDGAGDLWRIPKYMNQNR